MSAARQDADAGRSIRTVFSAVSGSYRRIEGQIWMITALWEAERNTQSQEKKVCFWL